MISNVCPVLRVLSSGRILFVFRSLLGFPKRGNKKIWGMLLSGWLALTGQSQNSKIFLLLPTFSTSFRLFRTLQRSPKHTNTGVLPSLFYIFSTQTSIQHVTHTLKRSLPSQHLPPTIPSAARCQTPFYRGKHRIHTGASRPSALVLHARAETVSPRPYSVA